MLIIEDDSSLAEVTRKLLLNFESDIPPIARRITTVEVVADLETALAVLPAFDAVLCDGEFLARPGSTEVGKFWGTVVMLARRLWVPCIIYSGNVNVTEDAATCGVAALEKSAKIEVLHAVIIAVHDSLASLRTRFGKAEPTATAA